MTLASPPRIPLSPLVEECMQCSSDLAVALQDRKVAKALRWSRDSRSLAREQSVMIAMKRRCLDQYLEQIQRVHAYNALAWDANVIAYQVAVIDSQLFALRPCTCHLLDFQRYLTHSFAHQLIDHRLRFGMDVHRLTHQLVCIAHLLLHVYRDFSGLAALIHAFQLPAVRRLDVTTPEDQAVLTNLAAVVASSFAHSHTLRILTSELPDVPAMVAVPCLDLGGADSALLDQCQYHGHPPPPHLSKTPSRRSSVSWDPGQNVGLTLPDGRLFDLACLGQGDLLVHHWLLSRVYLTEEQLDQISLLAGSIFANLSAHSYGIKDEGLFDDTNSDDTVEIIVDTSETSSAPLSQLDATSLWTSWTKQAEAAPTDPSSPNNDEDEVWTGYPRPVDTHNRPPWVSGPTCAPNAATTSLCSERVLHGQ